MRGFQSSRKTTTTAIRIALGLLYKGKQREYLWQSRRLTLCVAPLPGQPERRVLQRFRLRVAAAGILKSDDLLDQLFGLDPRAASIVEMWFYGRLEECDIAAELQISLATVKRDW